MDADKLVDFSVNVILYPVCLTEDNKYKTIRLFGWLLNITIWIPFVIIGFLLLFLSIIIELIQDV